MSNRDDDDDVEDEDDDGYSGGNDDMMVCIVEDSACTRMSTLSYWSLNKNVPSLYGLFFVILFWSNTHTQN